MPQGVLPPAGGIKRTSILRRAMRQMVLLTVLILLTLALTSLIVVRSLLQQRAIAQVITVAATAEASVDRTLDDARVHSALIAREQKMEQLFGGSLSAADAQLWLAGLIAEHDALQSVTVYASDGRMLAARGTTLPFPAGERANRLTAVTGASGWEWIDTNTLVRDASGAVRGVLVARYDTAPLLGTLQSALLPVGDTAQILFGREDKGRLIVLPAQPEKNAFSLLDMGPAAVLHDDGLPLAVATRGKETVGLGEDYRGTWALGASRYLPTLGWGMTAQVDYAEVMAGVHRLVGEMLAIGAALLLLALVLAYLLSRELTRPLMHLTAKVAGMKPGNWATERTVTSGDEVEKLDTVFSDMAQRLKGLYDNLEEQVRERTQELQEEFARERTILQTIEYGVLMVNADGAVVEANPTAARLLQCEQAQLAGASAADMLHLTTHAAPMLGEAHPVTASLRSGTAYRSPQSAHMSLERADESLLPVLLQVSPLVLGGRVTGAIVVFQDMSDERQVDYMKSEFISLASHQLRTPLSALRWYLELFGDEGTSFSAEQQDYLKQMQGSVERMVNLLNALLHAARLEEKGIVPDAHPVDLTGLLKEIGDEVGTLAHAAGMKANFVLPAQPVSVVTDSTLLSIVLQNLCGNAVKYSKKGGAVTVTLRAVADGVQIDVHDDGIGIPPDEHARVFEKFFRATNVRRIDTDGNGLGLHISKAIVDRLNGTIGFESVENMGSTFTVHLPASITTQTQAAA